MFNLIPWRQTSSVCEPSRHPFALLRNDFDHLVGQCFNDWRLVDDGHRAWGVDIDDNENEFVVKFEVPGFETGELDVNIKENLLTVKAERNAEGENEKSYSRFEKSVLLPNNIDLEQIDAKHHNGILEIHAPKKPESVGRRIEVKS